MSDKQEASVTHDHEAGGWYISLKPSGKVHRTRCTRSSVNFDFDDQGNIIGIEILDGQ